MSAGARATHPSDIRTWPRSTRRTMQGGKGHRMGNGESVGVSMGTDTTSNHCGKIQGCTAHLSTLSRVKRGSTSFNCCTSASPQSRPLKSSCVAESAAPSKKRR